MVATPHSLLDRTIVLPAIHASFRKLNPRHMVRNPVMFVAEVCAMVTTLDLFLLMAEQQPAGFVLQITIWLWFTVLFANFADAVAEGRSRAHADALRRSRVTTMAHKILPDETTVDVPERSLRRNDIVRVSAGEVIPADGEVIEGSASVNEAAVTGESAPVIREAGGDRSGVTGGTTVLSDEIRVRVTAEPGESFIDRIIELVEGARRQKTPNEIALSILLSALTLIFLVVVVTLKPVGLYFGVDFSVTVLVALLVCLAPTTIGGLLNAIGIAGIERMVQKNVLAMSGKAVETAGDIDVVLLDKTGTITVGDRRATEFVPAPGVDPKELADAAHLSSLADNTPEGRSIVELAEKKYGVPHRDVGDVPHAEFVPFTATTRMSGINIDGRQIRKGSADSVLEFLEPADARFPDSLRKEIDRISRAGGTALIVADQARPLGVVQLKDVVKSGLQDRFRRFRATGIRTVMLTGDNKLTADAIAREAGIDDVRARARPEDKLALIRREQAVGHLVAMAGDGTNDAPALAQADVGVAMHTGTQAAKEAGNMVDLDSDPTKLLDVVEVGKELLMTRGALTTFSIANDVGKYFAIIPAMLLAHFPQVEPLNIMRLETPERAILSAVIFNALIIVALIPLALNGVKFRPLGAAALLRRNLLIFGIGGIAASFVGIKLIDVVLGVILNVVGSR